MAVKRYLIDTNAIIDFLGGDLPIEGVIFLKSIINIFPSISVVNRIELLSINSTPDYVNILNLFISDLNVINLNEEIIQKCIEIRKSRKTKLPDALIAATAIVNNLTLITRNTSDFKHLIELEIINPHSI